MSNVIPASRSRVRNFLASGVAHPGLVLAKYLACHNDESAAKRKAIEVARQSQQWSSKPDSLYGQAFARRQQQAMLRNSISFEGAIAPGTRMVLGLGGASPLETGLTLEHTYGVPIIPGTSLKGLAAHYFESVYKAEEPQRRFLFGDSEQSGFIAFHDAWIKPESLAREDEGILLDVMTPHHSHYYGGKRYDCRHANASLHDKIIPPTSFDDPTPVAFASVRGTFHFFLSWNDGSPLPENEAEHRSKWMRFAHDVLIEALGNWGVGGKTSSGYGRVICGEPSRIVKSASVVLPTPDEIVDAQLIERKEKAGGKISWRAKHVATNIAGPIQNSDKVPSTAKQGETIKLYVAYAKPDEIAFKHPTPELDAQMQAKKSRSNSPPRERRRR